MKDMTPIHPIYLGWQVDWPLFVKIPFCSGGRNWIRGEEFKWAELGVEEPTVAKSRTVSTKDYTEKRCRQSRIAVKQRGLIRRFLYSNQWCDAFFYETRDKILGKDE